MDTSVNWCSPWCTRVCDRARQNLGGIDVQVALCKARCRVKRLLMGIDTLHKTTFVSAGHGFIQLLRPRQLVLPWENMLRNEEWFHGLLNSSEWQTHTKWLQMEKERKLRPTEMRLNLPSNTHILWKWARSDFHRRTRKLYIIFPNPLEFVAICEIWRRIFVRLKR